LNNQEHTVSIEAARKNFYDWLDRKRPWAQPENKNVYRMMEEMVDAAAWCFRGDKRPTTEEVGELRRALCRFTRQLNEHPKDYDGPCMCAECRSQ